MGVFVASLAPLAGGVTTFGWYLYAVNNGGSYYMLWGLVLFGLVAFGRRVMRYREAAARGPVRTPASGTPAV